MLSKGVSVLEIESEALEKFSALQTGYAEGFVQFLPSEQVLPRCFMEKEHKISQLAVREDDIWTSSFPKCGTTWTQEMVWNIVHGVDLTKAKASSLEERVPFLELTGLTEPTIIESDQEKVA